MFPFGYFETEQPATPGSRGLPGLSGSLTLGQLHNAVCPRAEGPQASRLSAAELEANSLRLYLSLTAWVKRFRLAELAL